jgi:L,D-transpeptidase YcbB
MNGRAFLAVSALVLFPTSAFTAASRRVPATDPRPVVEDSIALIIRSRLQGTDLAEGEIALSLESLRRFYTGRQYEPAWLASPSSQASLVGAIRSAAEQGLDPADYHPAAIEAKVRLADEPGARILAETDLLLSDAYLTLATHRAIGRLDPRSFLPGWREPPRSFDAVASLEMALDSVGPARALDRADPTGHRFADLRAALATLRGTPSWPTVPPGPSLAAGDSGPRVAALRRRLEPHTAPGTMLSDDYDESLEASVREFQAHHGLDVDGIAGRRTIVELNVPVEQRIRQISLSLERLRWLPAPREGPRIEVLIPAFELRMLDGDSIVFRTRVIGGRHNWPTPSLTSGITSLTVNPYWNIPSRILALEVLPAVMKDPRYLVQHDMEVLSREGTRVSVDTIDWSRVDRFDFPYRIRQRPGPENALGRVKFVFENPFDVYLHDTPLQSAFAGADRALSHGCIRVQSALDLAMHVLGTSSWTRATLDSLIATGAEQSVRIPRPVPVEIIYLTAWIGDDGRLQYRDDVYDLDQDLERRLMTPSGMRTESGSEDCLVPADGT